MLPMYGGANQGNPQGRDMMQDLKDWWSRTGTFTRFITYSTLTTAVLSMFTPVLFLMLANSAGLTILHLELWRPFTASFVHTSIVQLLFIFLALLPTCAREEQSSGTTRFLLDFFIKNWEIHMLTNCVTLLLGLMFYSDETTKQLLWGLPTYGLWCLFMTYLTKRCLENPNGVSQLCCFPVQVPNKWYPLVFILLFSLFGGPFLALTMAYLVAVAHFKCLDSMYVGYLNTTRLQNWEQKAPFSWLKSSSHHIEPQGIVFDQTQNNPPARAQPTASVQPPSNQAFSGKGVAIGGTDPNSRENPNVGLLGRLGNQNNDYNQLDATSDETDDADAQRDLDDRRN